MSGRFAFTRKMRSMAIVSLSGCAAFCGICVYTGDPRFYRAAMPVIHMLEPETVHRLAVKMLKNGLVAKPRFEDPHLLKTQLWNLEFGNPVGIAAGFDKHAEAIPGLNKLGFGFVEIGSVTPEPQDGNPKPRLFLLESDKAIINRYGFNSEGHEIVYERLENLTANPHQHRGIIGVNLGRNKNSQDVIGDYVQGVKKFGNVADYLVINVSSPNTVGLRALQYRKELSKLIDKVIEARNNLNNKNKPPLLLKIAPDLTEADLKDIAAVLTRPGKRIDGVIISNSTTARPLTLRSASQVEDGGLTGEPLRKMSTNTIRMMYALTKGELCIIGVGGISSGLDAYEKIRAGASLVQLYSALVYEGFPVITKVKQELSELLKMDGFNSVTEAVGADHHVKVQ